MTYLITITDTKTGVSRTMTDDYKWEDDEAIEFMWSEGNYSCDCNRGLFFAREGGEPDPDVSCGDTRYRVKVRDAAGKLVYEDDLA